MSDCTSYFFSAGLDATRGRNVAEKIKHEEFILHVVLFKWFVCA